MKNILLAALIVSFIAMVGIGACQANYLGNGDVVKLGHEKPDMVYLGSMHSGQSGYGDDGYGDDGKYWDDNDGKKKKHNKHGGYGNDRDYDWSMNDEKKWPHDEKPCMTPTTCEKPKPPMPCPTTCEKPKPKPCPTTCEKKPCMTPTTCEKPTCTTPTTCEKKPICPTTCEKQWSPTSGSWSCKSDDKCDKKEKIVFECTLKCKPVKVTKDIDMCKHKCNGRDITVYGHDSMYPFGIDEYGGMYFASSSEYYNDYTMNDPWYRDVALPFLEDSYGIEPSGDNMYFNM